MKTRKISLSNSFNVALLLISAFLASCSSGPTAPGTASDPKIIWAKCFGGSDADVAFAICHTSDGGSIVVGATNSSDGDNGEPVDNITDLWIVKLTSDGMIEWKKKLGGSGADIANAVRQTADGGYIVAGQSDSKDGDLIAQHQYGGFDIWIMKLDYQGNTIWRTTHGGSRDDIAEAVIETHDGNFIIAGATQSNDLDVTGKHGSDKYSVDFWVIKLNQNGVFVWEKAYGGSGDDDPHSIEETTDGFIIAGSSKSNDGDVTGHHGMTEMPDAWIVKIDGMGNLQWQKSFGGTGWDEAIGAFQTPDGGYIAAVYEQSGDGDVTTHVGSPYIPNCWMLKLKADGSIQWQKAVSGVIPSSLRKTRDGGFVISGYNPAGPHGKNDMWIGKFNATADLQWQKTIGGSDDDIAYGVDECDDGSYMLGGVTYSTNGDITGNHGMDDVAVVKIKP